MFQNENETSCDEGLIKLKHHLDHREKKLKEISVLLAEINIDLTTVFIGIMKKKYFYIFKGS